MVQSAESFKTQTATLGVVEGYLFMINSIIGMGLLTLPWLFDQSGWFMFILVDFMIGLTILALGFVVLDLLSRAEIICRMQEDGQAIKIQSLFSLLSCKPSITYAGFVESSSGSLQTRIPVITERRFDISEISSMLLGNW